MPAMIFDQCCGCIELRTGCLIIGYLNLVGEILLIILGLLGVIAGGVVVAADGKEQEVELGAGVLVVSIIVLLVVFFLLAFTIVLLVGLHQSKRGHVKAYLIYAVIFLVIYIVLFFASFASPVTVGGIIKELITILLSIYFILVIRSYYYKMDDASKRPAVYNTA